MYNFNTNSYLLASDNRISVLGLKLINLLSNQRKLAQELAQVKLQTHYPIFDKK